MRPEREQASIVPVNCMRLRSYSFNRALYVLGLLFSERNNELYNLAFRREFLQWKAEWGGTSLRDLLSLVDHLDEKFPDLLLWPAGSGRTASSRSLCETFCLLSDQLEETFPRGVGEISVNHAAIIWRGRPALRRVATGAQLPWCAALSVSPGPFLFGPASAVDAFAAPICAFATACCLPLSGPIVDYARRLDTLSRG